MTNSTYTACKGMAYSLLASIASCDHQNAKAKGYSDGWKMLLDKHDDTEMAAFCTGLPEVLSQAQATVLLDGLAKEYTEFSNWPDFVTACVDHPDWIPSHGTVAQRIAKQTEAKLTKTTTPKSS